MLNPFGRDSDPNSYSTLQKRILQRLKSARVNEQIVDTVQRAFVEALTAENVVLSRVERQRLLADIVKLVLDDVAKTIKESE